MIEIVPCAIRSQRVGDSGSRYTEAMRITGSSDLNGFGPVGKDAACGVAAQGVCWNPAKGAGSWIGKLGGTTDIAAIRP